MIKVINREVKREAKIYLGLTARQLLFVVIGAVLGVAVAFLLKVPILVKTIFPLSEIGLICGYLGFVPAGRIKPEQAIKKKILTVLYHNQNRPFRTLNRYVKAYRESRIPIGKPARRKKEKEAIKSIF